MDFLYQLVGEVKQQADGRRVVGLHGYPLAVRDFLPAHALKLKRGVCGVLTAKLRLPAA